MLELWRVHDFIYATRLGLGADKPRFEAFVCIKNHVIEYKNIY